LETAVASATAAAAGVAVSLPGADADVLPALLDADYGRGFTVSADPVIHGAAFRASDGCPLGVLIFWQVLPNVAPVCLPPHLLYVSPVALRSVFRAFS